MVWGGAAIESRHGSGGYNLSSACGLSGHVGNADGFFAARSARALLWDAISAEDHGWRHIVERNQRRSDQQDAGGTRRRKTDEERPPAHEKRQRTFVFGGRVRR